MSKGAKAISLFTGVGGLDFGFEAAGVDTAVAVEFDHDCCETLRANRPSWKVFESPVEDVPSDEILKSAKCKRGDIDLLIGGPPCQPFSKSGYWTQGSTKRLDDPRADTLIEYLRIVEETLPKVIFLENVPGMSFSGKDEGIRFLYSEIEGINRRSGSKYVPSCEILRMVEYGVPQLRERFFMIASVDGREFRFPSPTHTFPEIGTGKTKGRQMHLFDEEQRIPFNSAWDALHDYAGPSEEELAKLKVCGKWGDLLPSIPEGENYLYHTNRKGGMNLFGWRTRYWGFLLKLAKAHPSWTIQAQPGSAIGPFHWDNRRLSHDELCRLMTFPNIIVAGGRTSLQKQAGNAVPSLMTEVLGREIMTQFFGIRYRRPLRLMPRKAPFLPSPNQPTPVPEKYHHLEGDHNPHPGTGRGPMAIRRKSQGEASGA